MLSSNNARSNPGTVIRRSSLTTKQPYYHSCSQPHTRAITQLNVTAGRHPRLGRCTVPLSALTPSLATDRRQGGGSHRRSFVHYVQPSISHGVLLPDCIAVRLLGYTKLQICIPLSIYLLAYALVRSSRHLSLHLYSCTTVRSFGFVSILSHRSTTVLSFACTIVRLSAVGTCINCSGVRAGLTLASAPRRSCRACGFVLQRHLAPHLVPPARLLHRERLPIHPRASEAIARLPPRFNRCESSRRHRATTDGSALGHLCEHVQSHNQLSAQSPWCTNMCL